MKKKILIFIIVVVIVAVVLAVMFIPRNSKNIQINIQDLASKIAESGSFEDQLMQVDSEMVIPLTGQTAVAVIRLKQRLSQFDAGRNPVKIHLLNRQRFIFIDVFGPRHSLLAIQSRNHHPDQDEHRYEFHHSFHHEQSIIYFGQK